MIKKRTIQHINLLKPVFILLFSFFALISKGQVNNNKSYGDHFLVPRQVNSKIISKETDTTEYSIILAKIITDSSGRQFVRCKEQRVSGKVTRFIYYLPKDQKKDRFFIMKYRDYLMENGFNMHHLTRSKIIFRCYWESNTHVMPQLVDINNTDPRKSHIHDYYTKNIKSKTYHIVFATIPDFSKPGNYYFLDIIETTNRNVIDINELTDVLQNEGSINLYNVLFDPDKSEVKEESFKSISVIANYMKSNPDKEILVTGHTDNTGNPGYNLRLSIARANSVKKKLVEEFGIESERLSVKGYGDTKPVSNNNSEYGRQLNRRVEIQVVKH
jgi:outer membrane protein OmpA-like peptidoglycan-associated protein